MGERDDLEEEYGFRQRKEQRKERRIASAKDRSQYKKSDLDKKTGEGEMHPNIKIDPEKLKKGRVLSLVSQDITVESEGELYTCVLRGLLKRDVSRQKNLVAVGDIVQFEETGSQMGLIAHVETRKSVLARADNLSRRRQQIIAANVDQVLITVSIETPPLKPFLVDRYIIAAEKGGMAPVIVVNKIDLLEESEDQGLFEEMLRSYEAVDIPVLSVSAELGEGIDALREVMKDKVSVFSGQSGVGKSSLINIIAGLDLVTKETVKKTRKGSHTTTSAKLIQLDFGGWCVDTPGIKSFGVWDLEQEEVEAYFSEIHDVGQGCRFSSCTHTHEPECAVQAAVEAEEISFLRYQSYCQLIKSIGEEHKRR